MCVRISSSASVCLLPFATCHALPFASLPDLASALRASARNLYVRTGYVSVWPTSARQTVATQINLDEAKQEAAKSQGRQGQQDCKQSTSDTTPIMLKVYKYPSEDGAVDALRKYGFCLMKSSRGRDEDAGILAERRFALSDRTKAAMTPVRSSSTSSAPEEGFSSSSVHKDAYHYTAFGRSKKEAWLPWGFAPILRDWKFTGARLFEAINRHILGHHDQSELMQLLELGLHDADDSDYSDFEHSFRTDEDYEIYLNAVKDSNHHVLSCFRYHASNPSEFHVAAHVDKGVLTICENPNSLEICHKGRWYALGPQPKGVVAVLAGYSLERTTSGLFQAALHRVRNEGARSSRVTKIRFDPNLVLCPSAIIAFADEELCAMLPDPPDYLSVRDMMVAFNSTHTSVNSAPATLSRGMRAEAFSTGDAEGLHSFGMFSGLPKDLLHNFFRDWICDLEGVFLLSATCKSFRALLGSEEYLIPLADRSTRFSWDWALGHRGPRLVVPFGGNPNKWLSLLSKELKKSHVAITIVVRDGDGSKTSFKIKPWLPMGKIYNAFASAKGVATASIRFLIAGERVNEDETPYQLFAEDGEVFDCVLVQVGD